MSAVAGDVVVTPEEITPAWLSAVLGEPVAGVGVRRIGTGQMGSCYRLTTDTGRRLLAKLPAPDPGTAAMLAGAYRGEVRFYADLAATVDVRVPRAFHAAIRGDGAAFTLLLEDLDPWQPGDQLAGCTPEQARAAVVNLAGLHGPRWCDPALTGIDGLSLNGPEDAKLLAEVYEPAVEIFLGGAGAVLGEEDARTLRRTAAVAPGWLLGRAERFALTHGDYRLDNLLFPPAGPGVCAVDWQTLSLALPARDLAYVLATSLEPAARREHERALVAAYHRALTGYGVPGHSLADCWDDYRYAMLQGPLVTVLGSAYGTRSERNDAMFVAMARRSCQAIRDLGTLDLV